MLYDSARQIEHKSNYIKNEEDNREYKDNYTTL